MIQSTVVKLAEEKVYTKSEVETLILSIVQDISKGDEELLHHYSGDFRDAKEWIKQNIK